MQKYLFNGKASRLVGILEWLTIVNLSILVFGYTREEAIYVTNVQVKQLVQDAVKLCLDNGTLVTSIIYLYTAI